MVGRWNLLKFPFGMACYVQRLQYVSFREWKTSKLFNLIIWSRYSKCSKRTSPLKADQTVRDMQGKWVDGSFEVKTTCQFHEWREKKSVNQFRFSHVKPSCFGPNLGRNQPNISLQRPVWALQVAALHNLGKDAPASESIMATCDAKPLFFKLHLVTSDSIGPTNLTAASMEPDIQRNANVSPKIHIYKNDILRGNGMTWQLVTRNCGWNGGPVYEATPTTGHQHIYTWQRQMHGFLTYVETTWNKINQEILSWLWPLFDLPIFVGLSIDTPSAPNLSLSTSCRVRAPLEECKSTWVRKTYVANVWRVCFTSRENSERKFFGPSFKWPETTPLRAFMVGAPGSNIPAGWVNDKKLALLIRVGKKKQPGNERKLAGVLSTLSKVCMVPSCQANSRSPWNWYWWPFASKLSSLTSDIMTSQV